VPLLVLLLLFGMLVITATPVYRIPERIRAGRSHAGGFLHWMIFGDRGDERDALADESDDPYGVASGSSALADVDLEPAVASRGVEDRSERLQRVAVENEPTVLIPMLKDAPGVGADAEDGEYVAVEDDGSSVPIPVAVPKSRKGSSRKAGAPRDNRRGGHGPLRPEPAEADSNYPPAAAGHAAARRAGEAAEQGERQRPSRRSPRCSSSSTWTRRSSASRAARQ